MAFTYNGVASSSKDRIRFLVGDTIEVAGKSLTDEDIAAVLLVQTNVMRAAAECARALAARYAVVVNTVVGKTSTYAETRFKHFMELADKLEAQVDDVLGAPVLASDADDGTSRPALFDLGMHDWDYVEPDDTNFLNT